MPGRMPTERSFGVSVGVACVAAAAFSGWRGHSAVMIVLAAVGGVLTAGGLLAPRALRAPNRVWWRFATTLGWINARAILTLVFVLVLTPMGALGRLLGRNPLRGPQGDTGWLPYPARRRDSWHYEHMF